MKACGYLLAVMSSTLLFVGCASVPPTTTATHHAGDVASLTNWHASGRIAVSGVNGGGSGSFEWMQENEQSQIRLRGPMGMGSLSLTMSHDSLQLDAGDGVLKADQAQAQLNARLGAEVPLRSLRYWMLGLAAPGESDPNKATPMAVGTQDSETQVLLQSGWRIEYSHYVELQGLRLPAKWIATQGDAKVRVLVDRWNIP